MNARLQSWWTAFCSRHVVLEALVALSLAFLIWLYIYSRDQNSVDHVQIPVQVQLAQSQRDQYLLETSGAQKVTVSFSGPSMRIRELRRKLQRGLVQANITLTIPEDRLNEATFTETIRIDADYIQVPPGILAEIADEGTLVTATAHRVAELSLPVKFDHTGDARVTQVEVEPATVLVRGPQQVLDRVQSLSTQTFAVTAPPEGFAESIVRSQINLVTSLEGRAIQTTPRVVTVRCKVQPRRKIYQLSDVPVQFLCPPQFPWRPRFGDNLAGKVNLRIIGPVSDAAPPVLAFVDLTTGQQFRGRNLEPLRLQLPKEFTLVDASATVITYYLDEMTVPASVPDQP